MVIQALAEAELIKRDKKGRWYPIAKHAVYPSLSEELLAHLSEGVARFIETITRNVETQDKREVVVRKVVQSADGCLFPQGGIFENSSMVKHWRFLSQ